MQLLHNLFPQANADMTKRGESAYASPIDEIIIYKAPMAMYGWMCGWSKRTF